MASAQARGEDRRTESHRDTAAKSHGRWLPSPSARIPLSHAQWPTPVTWEAPCHLPRGRVRNVRPGEREVDQIPSGGKVIQSPFNTW